MGNVVCHTVERATVIAPADRFSPYLLARACGGPVSWEIDGDGVAGSDTSHVLLGGGLNIAVPAGFSAVVDVSAVGERSIAVGLSRTL